MHFDVDTHTIFLGVTGSHAYGMARAGSDVDVRGACIPPREVRDSHYKVFEQFLVQQQRGAWGPGPAAQAIENILAHPTAGESYRQSDPVFRRANGVVDLCIYSLAKLVALAANNNPNVLELLFLDERDVLYADAKWRRIVEHRDIFLSRKCKHTYLGYAHAQLKRIKGHREWLLNPPTTEPTRKDFDLPEESVLPADVRNQIDEVVKKIIGGWKVDDGLDVLSGATLDVLMGRMREFHATLLACTDDMLDEKVYELGAASIGLSKDVLYAIRQERRYRAARKHWEQYQRWIRERNPARAELEAKYGFDCYSADTQFLTENGWKCFDEIQAGERLATVHVGRDMPHRRFGSLEYQAPTERFDGTFTGNMYHFGGHNTDVLVTPNHRMLYRQVSRRRGETYGVVMEEAARMPDAFDFVRTIRPRTKTYGTRRLFAEIPIKPEAFLRLMGWYLTDGSANMRKGKRRTSVHDVRVSQKKNGRSHGEMVKFQNRYGKALQSSMYAYDKKGLSGDPITEIVLSVRHRGVCERIVSECGRTDNKRIPRWVFSLSKRHMETLFDAMCGGDGTVKRSWIYYSSLKGLADDVNELALHCGWETSLWGPYAIPTDLSPDCVMYHVHVDKHAEEFQRFVRNKSIDLNPVKNHRIVCFTVPNGTLITRRNGRVGIHGNSKHGAHLIRLMRTGHEILTEGVLRVRRPDAEELLAIRDGALSYDELIAEAERIEKAVLEAEVSSKLPKAPQVERIDEVLLSIL
jgi:predicted nucleotidyltransferase